MNYVIKGVEKVAVSSREDAKALMRALSDHDSKETISRQDVIGKDVEFNFYVCWDDEAVATTTQDDAERILHWMLSLGCAEITIKNKQEGKKCTKS